MAEWDNSSFGLPVSSTSTDMDTNSKRWYELIETFDQKDDLASH
jgi:hypothetical protein